MNIKEGMKIESPQELIEMGYCFLEEGITVKNNLKKVLKEKGLNYTDLARLIGESRQRVSSIINYNTTPNVDFALKTSYVLNKPVENLYEITDNAWTYKPDTMSLYYDMVEKEIISHQKYLKRKAKTNYEYFDLETNEPLTEKDFAKKRREIEKYINKEIMGKTEEKDIDFEEDFDNMEGDILRDILEKRFVKAYRKIGIKITPYRV